MPVSQAVTELVFIHGWGVHHTKTYGKLPERIKQACPGLKTHDLHLGRYISFRDEVRMDDVTQAMEAAIQAELHGKPFAAVTHSTGGPVVRSWWQRYYREPKLPCPMTHAVHLAAAQFGSAMAQLGKGTLGKMKSFFEAVEPGQGILDWLELGSPESWALNEAWIHETPGHPGPYHFSLTGQNIDRKFYDNLNSYTGEMGSDGVIRVAAANLNAGHLNLIQKKPSTAQQDRGKPSRLETARQGLVQAPLTPFSLVPGASHVGKTMGIMRSVKARGRIPPVVQSIKQCLQVQDDAGYQALTQTFQQRTQDILNQERVEFEDRLVLDRTFLHDACSMVIVRVRDEEGYTPPTFRVTFTGEDGDPNKLPKGFLLDRQRNRRNPGTITFFLNYDVLLGCPAVYLERPGHQRKKIRSKLTGLSCMGFRIEAFPDEGFAHYHPCEAPATPELLHQLLRPHETTLVDIVLKRVVHTGTFSLTHSLKPASFKKTPPGPVLD